MSQEYLHIFKSFLEFSSLSEVHSIVTIFQIFNGSCLFRTLWWENVCSCGLDLKFFIIPLETMGCLQDYFILKIKFSPAWMKMSYRLITIVTTWKMLIYYRGWLKIQGGPKKRTFAKQFFAGHNFCGIKSYELVFVTIDSSRLGLANDTKTSSYYFIQQKLWLEKWTLVLQ